ncbi:DUF4124 domain-containing protein [Tahibacter amnicola]|uniref:DUF4124 domain-containing protein n=1 Tax=Tahibacter amnicola TaxID=2976241 RepID=A0ABY6BIB2_9GAMM|nr:DUF4124 domain-containing protein [Tahibacter amnicola]UXI69247.1 DUF4124 domain-containing protein [Tahibacter amnicola]
MNGRPWAWLLLAAIGAAAAWWYFFPATLPTAIRHTLPASPTVQTAPPPLYKWRDANGRLNVTDQPPPDRPYETVRYNPDTNVVPGYKRPEDKKD